jgi:hypothetical protein
MSYNSSSNGLSHSSDEAKPGFSLVMFLETLHWDRLLLVFFHFLHLSFPFILHCPLIKFSIIKYGERVGGCVGHNRNPRLLAHVFLYIEIVLKQLDMYIFPMEIR